MKDLSEQIQAEYAKVPSPKKIVPSMSTSDNGEVFWYLPRARAPRSFHTSRENSLAERTISRDPEADDFALECPPPHRSPLPSPHRDEMTLEHVAIRVTDVPPSLR